MIPYLFPIYLAFAGRLHGGGFISGVPRIVRNVLFALPFAYHPLYIEHNYMMAIIAIICAYIAINAEVTGFWGMGTGQDVAKGDWLEKIVSLTGVKINTLAWDIRGMYLKGLILGLGTLTGIVCAGCVISFPFAYYIGMRTRWSNALAEALVGLFAGLSLLLYYV